MSDQASGSKEAIFARANSVSKVLEAGGIIFLLAALAKLAGTQSLEIQGVPLEPGIFGLM